MVTYTRADSIKVQSKCSVRNSVLYKHDSTQRKINQSLLQVMLVSRQPEEWLKNITRFIFDPAACRAKRLVLVVSSQSLTAVSDGHLVALFKFDYNNKANTTITAYTCG